MITKMTGLLTRVLDDEVRLQVGPFEYQVLVPEAVRRQIQTARRPGDDVPHHRIPRRQPGGNRFVPRRIGFNTEAELEFFELFCTVEKIGAKKALKAMARPVKEIADAISRQDAKWLTTLPGIGADDRRADRHDAEAQGDAVRDDEHARGRAGRGPGRRGRTTKANGKKASPRRRPRARTDTRTAACDRRAS